MKKERPEIGALYSILDKLNKKFPNFMSFALGDFMEDKELGEDDLKKRFINQIFLGWIFLEYSLYDGKTIPQIARQVIKLSSDEEKMLSNIENAAVGFFKFVRKKEDMIIFEDIMTNKRYEVKVIDLDYKFTKGKIIEAKLALNFEGDTFLFGGFTTVPNKREVENEINSYKVKIYC